MKITNLTEETIVDCRTGEVTAQRRASSFSVGGEPSYIKLYLDDLMYVADIPKRYGQLLGQLLPLANYAGEDYGLVINLTAFAKQRIAEALGYKAETGVRTVNNGLSKLNAGKIIESVGRGSYRLNPYFFGKGNWKDIARIRMEFDYDEINGRTFAVVVKETEDFRKRSKKKKAPVETEQQDIQLEGQMSLDDTLLAQTAVLTEGV